MSMEKRTFILLVLSLLVIVLILFIITFYPISDKTVSYRLEIDSKCDLAKQSCRLSLPNNGFITLDLGQKAIPLMAQFPLEVTLDNLNAQRVSVDFKGISMDMGPNSIRLDAQNTQHYTGVAILPVCAQNTMQWQVDVYVQTPSEIIIAPFIFHTSQH